MKRCHRSLTAASSARAPLAPTATLATAKAAPPCISLRLDVVGLLIDSPPRMFTNLTLEDIEITFKQNILEVLNAIPNGLSCPRDYGGKNSSSAGFDRLEASGSRGSFRRVPD